MSKANQEFSTMMKRLMWIALVFLGFALIISMVAKKEATIVQQVIIDVAPLDGENYLINEADVLLTIERSFGFPLETMPLGAVDVERLERVLKEEPFVLEANAFINAENIVNISIVQRQPVLRIIDRNGSNYYLDENAFKMPLSKHFSARVLVATGNIPPYVLDYKGNIEDMLHDLFDLAIKIRDDELLQPMIEQIYINNKRELILVPKIGRQKILFGRYTSVEDKLKRLKIFYTEALPYEGWKKYRTIDLNFEGQIVAR